MLPLAVLTFFGGFIPIIGAFVAGAFAVLVALVEQRASRRALIVLGIVILVQQIEGNVLQPIIQGRGFNLHAAVVILAVTAGSSLAGIIGAFLSVPIAALIAVIYRYVRDELDERSPEVADDGTARPGRSATRPAPRSSHEQVAARRRPTSRRPDATRRADPRPGDAWECGAHRVAAAPDVAAVRHRQGGPTVAQRPEELVELLPEAEPLPRPGGGGRRPGRARRAWCWCTTWPATSTPRTPARWPGRTCSPACRTR